MWIAIAVALLWYIVGLVSMGYIQVYLNKRNGAEDIYVINGKRLSDCFAYGIFGLLISFLVLALFVSDKFEEWKDQFYPRSFNLRDFIYWKD